MSYLLQLVDFLLALLVRERKGKREVGSFVGLMAEHVGKLQGELLIDKVVVGLREDPSPPFLGVRQHPEDRF